MAGRRLRPIGARAYGAGFDRRGTTLAISVIARIFPLGTYQRGASLVGDEFCVALDVLVGDCDCRECGADVLEIAENRVLARVLSDFLDVLMSVMENEIGGIFLVIFTACLICIFLFIKGERVFVRSMIIGALVIHIFLVPYLANLISIISNDRFLSS